MSEKIQKAVAVVGRWCALDGQFGGIPIYNRAVGRGYNRLGVPVIYLCARWNDSLPRESYPEADVRIIRLDLLHIPSRLMRGRLGSQMRLFQSFHLSWIVKRRLEELIQAGEIQAAEFAESSLEGYHSMGKIGVPHFLRCHTPLGILKNYYPKDEFRFGSGSLAMEYRTIINAPIVTTPTSDLKNLILKAYNCPEDRASVVPNPVEADIYKPESALTNTSVILHVGRLDSRKGGTVLGEAIPEIAEKHPEARFVFVGENRKSASRGVEENILARLPSKVRDSIVFTGYLDEPALVKRYTECGISVVPSKIYESFSYTAAQAMSCERPVIASRIGGIPEVVEDGKTGVLIEPGSSKELAYAVNRLLQNPEAMVLMGKSGRRKVVDEYSPEHVAQLNLSLLGMSIS